MNTNLKVEEMKCLHSGYCCIHYDVMIVDNPSLGIIQDNVIHKASGVRCKHLIGETPKHYNCAIHEESWYKETPCYAFTQIETSPDTPCRIGEYTINLENKNEN